MLDLFASARQSNGSVSEPSPECVDGDERAVGGEQHGAAGSDACPVAGFERSQARFAGLVEWVAGEQALGLEHSELEARLAEDARALARQVLQDQLDLRARVEQRADGVIGADATPRPAVERGHERDLQTVLGEVQVTRLAYRAAGSENLYPADARLNLPPVRHSQTRGNMLDVLDKVGSVREAASVLARDYELPLAEIQLDLCSFCEGLIERGLLVVESD